MRLSFFFLAAIVSFLLLCRTQAAPLKKRSLLPLSSPWSSFFCRERVLGALLEVGEGISSTGEARESRREVGKCSLTTATKQQSSRRERETESHSSSPCLLLSLSLWSSPCSLLAVPRRGDKRALLPRPISFFRHCSCSTWRRKREGKNKRRRNRRESFVFCRGSRRRRGALCPFSLFSFFRQSREEEVQNLFFSLSPHSHVPSARPGGRGGSSQR